jgi:hypothetical protein
MYVLSIRIDIVSAQVLSTLNLNIRKEDMISIFRVTSITPRSSRNAGNVRWPIRKSRLMPRFGGKYKLLGMDGRLRLSALLNISRPILYPLTSLISLPIHVL